jgi:hypothetical protein
MKQAVLSLGNLDIVLQSVYISIYGRNAKEKCDIWQIGKLPLFDFGANIRSSLLHSSPYRVNIVFFQSVA